MDGREEGRGFRSFSSPTGGIGGINKAITATTMKERREENAYSTISTDYTGKRIHSTFLRNLRGVGGWMTNGTIQ